MEIILKNVTKSFKDRKAIDDLTLDINKEIFVFLGPNGAGKTTLINILCGLLQRDSGEVTIAGFDPRTDANKIRKHVGLVPQETALYDYLTAKENLEFHARFYGVPRAKRAERIREALQMAQLENRADDRVSIYSGGMKRRLALVRALIHDPDILILDEPTLGVDVQSRNEIWNRIKAIKEEKIILINTNYMDEADRLADRCAVLDQGKLIALDTPANLKKTYAGGVRLEALVIGSSQDIEQLKQTLTTKYSNVKIELSGQKDTYSISIPAKTEPNQFLAEFSQLFQSFGKLRLQNLNVRTPTLDDVFLELTGTRLRD